jgi:UDP-N-acetylglucosamine 1-carboxyvinyltransferase
MDKLLIQGGIPLHGTVKVNGSKNASLPIMAAALLCEAPVIIDGVPNLHDVKTMADVLRSLGASVEYNDHMEQVAINCGEVREVEPPPELVRRMRASFLVLGSLLARYKRVRISLPGGCAIGNRPVDLHLKGLNALGGRFTMSNGRIEGEATVLRGTRIYIDYPSVGATENIITAAVLAHGTTVYVRAP